MISIYWILIVMINEILVVNNSWSGMATAESVVTGWRDHIVCSLTKQCEGEKYSLSEISYVFRKATWFLFFSYAFKLCIGCIGHRGFSHRARTFAWIHSNFRMYIYIFQFSFRIFLVRNKNVRDRFRSTITPPFWTTRITRSDTTVSTLLIHLPPVTVFAVPMHS